MGKDYCRIPPSSATAKQSQSSRPDIFVDGARARNRLAWPGNPALDAAVYQSRKCKKTSNFDRIPD
jgi:hypothetical protein